MIAENYNRLLYADGKGLLPAAVGPSVGDAAKKEAAFGFDPWVTGIRSSAEFRGESDPVDGRADADLDLAVPQAETAQAARRPRSRWRSTTATRR